MSLPSVNILNRLATVTGPLAGLTVGLLLHRSGYTDDACWTAGITLWVAIWWVFESIPIPVTSLIPLALFPAVGVLTHSEVATAYGNPMVLLLLGGFLLSTAMAKSGAHRRLALNMVHLFGASSPRRIVAGFMVAAAVLSMWISNTATTLMLLPVALAVLENVKHSGVRVALLLGIAYGASVGGIGTPIGTPPNLIFMEVYRKTVGEDLSFTQWMKWAIPIVVLMIPCMVWWLTRKLPRTINIELPKPGRWQKAEVRTLCVFAITALLWMTRQEPFGGWTQWSLLEGANDAGVAFMAVVAMFLIPDGRGSRLLDWSSAVQIPWGVLLLFSGGITIASAFVESGLSETLANSIASMTTLTPLLMIWLICITVTFLTEITSNTATTTLLMPVLAAVAIGAGIDPLVVMFPAAISASFAFMLPVATAPNAVVFGSGEFSVQTMARNGFMLNLFGSMIVSTVVYLLFL